MKRALANRKSLVKDLKLPSLNLLGLDLEACSKWQRELLAVTCILRRNIETCQRLHNVFGCSGLPSHWRLALSNDTLHWMQISWKYSEATKDKNLPGDYKSLTGARQEVHVEKGIPPVHPALLWSVWASLVCQRAPWGDQTCRFSSQVAQTREKDNSSQHPHPEHRQGNAPFDKCLAPKFWTMQWHCAPLLRQSIHSNETSADADISKTL